MLLPADAPDEEREFWAGLSAIVGICHDGPELGTEQRFFQRLEAACASFGVSAAGFERLARRFGWHYSRSWDCWVDRETYLDIQLRESAPVSRAVH